MGEGIVFDILRRLSEQNVKPHMAYLILKLHEDGGLHRGIELVKGGHDVTEVYDTVELLVAKGDLTRMGKQTKITERGKKIIGFAEEIIKTAERMVL